MLKVLLGLYSGQMCAEVAYVMQAGDILLWPDLNRVSALPPGFLEKPWNLYLTERICSFLPPAFSLFKSV